MFYITGDTHGDFYRIKDFCEKNNTTRDDVMIILGDAGINYYGGRSDREKKHELNGLPIKLFCIHGNHERRPETVEGYQIQEWQGGKVYVEPDYPNLIFAKDGEIYEIAGLKTIVIGGAYSVDKYYRLSCGYHWFEDEQPSAETKVYVEEQLAKNGWKIDVVLSHTVPFEYMPIDMFIKGLDQSTVDNSTEDWLSDIESKLSYHWWYAGHFHTSRKNKKLQLMFEDIEPFMKKGDYEKC